MTVVAAEAVPAVESTAASAAASSGGKAAATKAKPQPGLSTRTKAKQKPRAREIVYTTEDGKERSAVLPGSSAPEHTWHRWIMAEFILAVVLVGASPFLRPGGLAGKAEKDIQPVSSLAGPVIRLTAVSLIYFILALMAQGPTSGKIAAAFGGLVLLGTAFNSLPEFTTLASAFGGKPPASSQPMVGDEGSGGEGPKR